MALSEFERKGIEKIIGTFCHDRTPQGAGAQVCCMYRIVGQNVILAESRPRWDDPEEWLTLDFAKLTDVKSRKIWKLYWMRASGKWERYEPCRQDPSVENLVTIIDQDRYGCFFG